MKRATTLHVVTPEPEAKKDDRVGLMNPKFKYTRAAETNVAATFKRVIAELKRKGKP